MKKFLPLFLLVGFLFLPQSAYAGLSEGCFPIVQCNSGEDFFANTCQVHIETLTGATDSCESVNGAPSAGKNWAFSCDAGCYEKGGGGGTVNLCPGGVMVGANCLIKLDVLDDDVHATNEGYKIYDGTDLTELVHLDTAGCADTEIAVSDSASATGWTCLPQASSPWTLNGADVYYNAGNVGVGTTTPATGIHLLQDSAGFAGGLRIENPTQTVTNDMWVTATESHMATNNAYRFQVGGLDTLYIEQNKVGIGTMTPGATLDIYSWTVPAMEIGNADAVGERSVAWGNLSTATAPDSFAQGRETTASGQDSVAFNYDTTASGPDSAAFNASTTAQGYNSASFGIGTISYNPGSMAVGRYNDVTKPVEASAIGIENDEDLLFMVGVGTSDVARANGLVVTSGGKVGLGDNGPSATLNVVGVSRASNEAAETNYTEMSHDGSNASINTVGAGRMDFQHDGGTLMTIEDTGQVGIGTTTPDADLHVDDTIRVGEDPSYPTVYGELKHLGSSNSFVINSHAGGGSWADMSFQTNASTKMFIESAGNVGIGTTSPSARLHAVGSSAGVWGEGTTFGGYFKDSNSTGYAYVGYGNLGIDARGSSGGGQFRDTSGTATTYVANGTAGINASGTSYGGVFSDMDSGIYGYAGFGDWSFYGNGKAYISGDVGIGTSPSYKLHVSDRMKMDGSTAGTWIEAGTNDWFFGRSGGNLRIYNAGDRMTFEPGGDVGIGTTNPNSKLHVVNGSNTFTAGGGVTGITANGTGWGAIITGGSQSKYAWLAYSSYSLLGNGIVSGSSWQTSSDARLKNILGDYESGLDEIMALDTVEFKYKDGNVLDLGSDALHIGLIAQEVQKIIPEAVSMGRDEMLSLEPNVVSMTMVNAIQELKIEKDEEIAELKSIVCELKPDAKVCNQ